MGDNARRRPVGAHSVGDHARRRPVGAHSVGDYLYNRPQSGLLRGGVRKVGLTRKSWYIPPMSRQLIYGLRMTAATLVVCSGLFAMCFGSRQCCGDHPVRARDLGIPFDGCHGPKNAITDVAGVLVGHATLKEDRDGQPLARTGVTAVLPTCLRHRSYFAAVLSHSGYGEMTGAHVIQETGYLDSPILLTNTSNM